MLRYNNLRDTRHGVMQIAKWSKSSLFEPNGSIGELVAAGMWDPGSDYVNLFLILKNFSRLMPSNSMA